MEDPGYPRARRAMIAAGASIVNVPVDRNGMIIATAVQKEPYAKLAYVTCSNQFPLGVTMSASRRMELLEWASRNRSWIVEDEYDAEYRYEGRPIAALQSLDRTGSVIYVGTFTRVLFNALRVGFLVSRTPCQGLRDYTQLHRPPSTLYEPGNPCGVHFGRLLQPAHQEDAGRLCGTARNFTQ